MQDEVSPPPADECYAQMGFQPFTEGPHLQACEWRRVQNSKLLLDMRQRYLWLQQLSGQPLVDQGYIVGWIPPLGLNECEFKRLMAALEKALAMGCITVEDWQQRKISAN